jgi:hypothetical protein
MEGVPNGGGAERAAPSGSLRVLPAWEWIVFGIGEVFFAFLGLLFGLSRRARVGDPLAIVIALVFFLMVFLFGVFMTIRTRAVSRDRTPASTSPGQGEPAVDSFATRWKQRNLPAETMTYDERNP